MGIEQRTRGTLSGPGPYLAEITNHLDPTYMGGVEVSLIRGVQSNVRNKAETYTVKYLSPFYGVTSIRHEGNNAKDYNDVQKSYGMWMVPPDIGTIVMIIFVDSDPNQGYWFGCVQDTYQNHMLPGIAASINTNMTPEQEKKYGTTYLPVAEFLKNTETLADPNINKKPKPIHPFADRLLAQGLLLDTIRGPTSSSARREVPSSVFGISTPGPLDTSDGAPKKKIGYSGNAIAPVSRLGGSSFVMDDGDTNGENELIRIRTRTGHQILMHNSQDLIYIANSTGTAWIELTSMGKIDIYAEDSVSIHTRGDFNFRADRDFNLEAGRNFNIAATEGNVNINGNNEFNLSTKKVQIESLGDYNLIVSDDLKISATNIGTTVTKDLNTLVSGNSNYSVKNKYSMTAATSAIKGTNDLSFTSDKAISFTAPVLNFNGPKATSPTAPTAPTLDVPAKLTLFSVPQRKREMGWPNGVKYKADNLLTIMQRVPMHEPWDHHENINPSQFSKSNTDNNIQPAFTTKNGVSVPASGSSASTPTSYKSGPGTDRGQVRGNPSTWTKDQAFLTKVKEVAKALNFNAIDLLAIINLESARSFDPAITNSLGYTGLIQFGNAAAKGLGTTTDYLRGLTRVQQMDYVYSYFNKLWGWPNAKVPNPSLGNIYLTVLLPAFRFAGQDEKIADATNPKTAAYWRSNPGFDPQHLGYFTPSMVESVVSQHRREVQKCLTTAGVGIDPTDEKTFLIVPEATVKSGTGGIVTSGSGNPVMTGQ
jgi:hypothetical protein